MMKPVQSEKAVKTYMVDIQKNVPFFKELVIEYDRLLDLVGNVDSSEDNIALVLAAMSAIKRVP